MGNDSSYHITTEIIIQSHTKCEALTTALVDDHTGFYIQPSAEVGDWYLCFDPVPYETADETILELCNRIQSLDPAARKEWDDALHREFYIGYEISPSTPCLQEFFSPKTLDKVRQLHATIGLAMYPTSEAPDVPFLSS